MTDQQNPMPPGWYPDPMRAGHQREWSGYEWVGPSVPLGAGKKGGFPIWLIPVIACLALALGAVVIGAIAGSSSDDDDPTAQGVADRPTTEAPTTTERATTTTERATTTTERPTTTTTTAPTTTTTTAPPPPTTAGPTVSQQNARSKAADYLSFMAFSRQGLIDQLKFEGFSEADATFGVDAQNADWNEQAAKKAADYLEFTSFSRQGLIDQLVFEGFSPAEAEYGVGTTGL